MIGRMVFAGVLQGMAGLQEIYDRIDAENSEDPRQVDDGIVSGPLERIYGLRMSERLAAFYPEASMALQIAARGQHIRRWEIPRDRYPRNREGYLKWRTTLYRFHADQLESLMQELGVDPEVVGRVQSLVGKRAVKTSPEGQVLEDVICLVFLEHYFEDFIASHPREKVIEIVRKTWGKMSEKGHECALRLPLGPKALKIVQEALGA